VLVALDQTRVDCVETENSLFEPLTFYAVCVTAAAVVCACANGALICRVREF
jgi:hypothetical protein